MEWVVMPTAHLIFRSLFVEQSQFLRCARQATSVLATRPGCVDGQGMNYLLLGLYVWPLVGTDWGEVCSCLPFLSLERACGRSLRVFDDGSDIRGRSFMTL